MPGLAYERYGLTGNPFRDLAVESLEDVTIFHVNQEVDSTMRTIRDEILDKENRAVVAVIGELGSGKTERLRISAAEAQERNGFVVYFEITEKTPSALRGLAHAFKEAAQRSGMIKAFGGASWIRAMASLEKTKDEKYDTKEAGRTIAKALNESAPAFLLLNDLHNLIESREVDAFAKVLQEITDQIKPGVLLMFTCYSSYLAWINVNHPALASRINRTFLLQHFSDDEAALLIAKKLLAKRIVENLDPTYPFDMEAVSALNAAAAGNPRRILELADLAIEYAMAHRAYHVDADMVKTVTVSAVRPSTPPVPSGGPSPAPKPVARPALSSPSGPTKPATPSYVEAPPR
jgi:type II secretory pathway predicted ATPase ExeA